VIGPRRTTSAQVLGIEFDTVIELVVEP